MIMIHIQKLKYYALAAIDLFLLQVHFWDWVDDSLRRVSVLAGLIVAIFTAIKLYQDITSKAMDKKLKSLDIQRKEEELRRFFEDKYANK